MIVAVHLSKTTYETGGFSVDSGPIPIQSLEVEGIPTSFLALSKLSRKFVVNRHDSFGHS
jgi:hypothetical protein